jgi:cytochrome oxidase Cu insertion factor (SCO1/SenC/PrrC family)
VLVLAGVVGYFAVVLGVPALVPYVRNRAVPNWALVAMGLVVSILAVGRAGTGAWMSRALLGLNVVVSALFALFLYVFLAVPGARGPAVGASAPDWSLVDQTGQTVRLADFRGAPLVLVFYRGHW